MDVTAILHHYGYDIHPTDTEYFSESFFLEMDISM